MEQANNQVRLVCNGLNSTTNLLRKLILYIYQIHTSRHCQLIGHYQERLNIRRSQCATREIDILIPGTTWQAISPSIQDRATERNTAKSDTSPHTNM